MPVSALGTHRDPLKDALTITVDGRQFSFTHVQTDLLSEAQITLALGSAASTAGVVLPPLAIHRNRDGSLALAVGTLAHDFIWPEDREDVADGEL